MDHIQYLHALGIFVSGQDPELHPEVLVIVLTTSKADEDILRSYDLHVNCYITKPVEMDQFTQVVKAIDHFWFSIATLPATWSVSMGCKEFENRRKRQGHPNRDQCERSHPNGRELAIRFMPDRV